MVCWTNLCWAAGIRDLSGCVVRKAWTGRLEFVGPDFAGRPGIGLARLAACGWLGRARPVCWTRLFGATEERACQVGSLRMAGTGASGLWHEAFRGRRESGLRGRRGGNGTRCSRVAGAARGGVQRLARKSIRVRPGRSASRLRDGGDPSGSTSAGRPGHARHPRSGGEGGRGGV